MNRRILAAAAVALAVALPASAPAEQLGKLSSALKRAQQFKDVEMTEAEEAQLGAEVSTRIRARYGVVQDQAAHRYVSLVGMALVMASAKPGPNWKFIILDTDAVNAFAAPGGFVHITKGALANLKSESELAGVLAHEIIHVTDKHTIRAIQKGKLVQMGADETVAGNSALMSKLADKAYEVIESGFGRGEELEADEKGIVIANAVGYAPQGMNGFLNMLVERNKSGQPAKNGLFASHPETKERIDKMTTQIATAKLTSTATVTERYALDDHVHSRWPPPRSRPLKPGRLAPPAPPPSRPRSRRRRAWAASPGPCSRAAASASRRRSPASGAARGAGGEDRLAKGGANPALVAVTVSAADLAAFKKAGD